MDYIKYETSTVDWCEENFLVVTKQHIISDILQKFATYSPPGTTREQIKVLVDKLNEME